MDPLHLETYSRLRHRLELYRYCPFSNGPTSTTGNVLSTSTSAGIISILSFIEWTYLYNWKCTLDFDIGWNYIDIVRDLRPYSY